MGATTYIGAAIKRKEDYRFLTGAGNYTDDVAMPHQTFACFVRSPHAHAKIKGIKKDKAVKAPGVVAIFTGDDLAAAKVNGLPCGWLITDVAGQPMKEPPHPCLAQGKARYVGDHVAIVIAETHEQARDAAELVKVEYEELPAVVRAGDARKKGAPVVHDIAPDNTCYVWGLGDKAAVDKAFAGAARVTTLEFLNNRLIPNAIEPRAANATYSRADDSYTLYVASQNPHVERLLMTAFVLGLPESKVRVVAPDVGGGFGSKIYLYAEDVVVTWASKQLERLVETAAREMKLDPVELRRRNFISEFPYQTPVALCYDTGNYEATLGAALKLADVAGFKDRREQSLRRGKLRGLGYACYIEACGIAPSNVAGSLGARAGLFEAGEVRVHPTGTVTVFTGSHAHGQGHETTFAQVVADRLGLSMEQVEIVHGDTSKVLFGMGTYGSRSIAVGGTAIVKALDKVVAKGKKIAAHLLEASEGDIEYDRGVFKVAGTDRKKTFGEVAFAAYVPHNYPLDKLEPGLNENAFYDPANFTFPAGSHICEIEVDPDTGTVRVVNFTAVDDFGKIINPMIVEGQVHGGLTQGIGQALTEGCHYDKDSGQLITGSYLDYCMPRADDVPTFKVGTKETPCTHNPLGVKGCGEAGAIGAPAAVMNALTDALGLRDIEMPATPQRIWRACQEMKKAA